MEKKIIAKYLYEKTGDKERKRERERGRNDEAPRRNIITMCNMYIIYAILYIPSLIRKRQGVFTKRGHEDFSYC